MPARIDDKALREHIAWCHEQRDQALAMLGDVQERGLRTWEGKGDGVPLVETTQARVTFLRNIVAAMDRLLEAAEARKPKKLTIR